MKAPASPAVRTVDLTKRFGATTAVDAVSLAIAAGAVHGLIGPNGAGKTTLFSILAGHVRPTSGAAEVLGFAPAEVNALRSRLGVLPQDAILPASDAVGELLVHFARLQDLPGDKAAAAARRALDEVAGSDWWGRRCGSLSHGMAKRVALAQAFLGDPEVALLDEPTAGLDPRAAVEVRQLVAARRGRGTIVVSSHDLRELEEICDSATILDRGKVVAHGSIDELTAADREVRVRLAPGTQRGSAPGQVPIARLRELARVTSAEIDEEKFDLIVRFDRGAADAEAVIGEVLSLLLKNDVRVSGVTKGRGLERRVMDLA